MTGHREQDQHYISLHLIKNQHAIRNWKWKVTYLDYTQLHIFKYYEFPFENLILTKTGEFSNLIAASLNYANVIKFFLECMSSLDPRFSLTTPNTLQLWVHYPLFWHTLCRVP